MRLPWGKHKGQAIGEVPAGYLAWLLEESRIGEPYRSAIKAELAWRLDLQPTPPSVRALSPPPDEIALAVEELIESGYRHLVHRHHPDTGGTHQKMVAVNGALHWLHEQGLARGAA